MECTLTITGVTGITTGGTLTSIVVAGESTNCTSVNVQIQSQPQPTVQVDTSTSPWTWTVTSQTVPEGCACGKEISVAAECDQKGESCKTSVSEVLNCIPVETCPNVTFMPTINPVPNSPGNYTVTVTATLNSSSAYTAELVEGAIILDGPISPLPGVPGNLVSLPESLPANTSRTYEVVIISPTSCPPSQLVVTAPGSGGGNGGNGGGGFCNTLLWTALTLIATGVVLGVIAVCTGNVVLGIAAGGGTLALGMIILLLWAHLCGRLPGGCETLRTANCMVSWIIAYGWIIVVLLGFLQGGWCGVSAFVGWGNWALVKQVIEQVQLQKNCPAPWTCSVLPGSTSAT